MSPQEILGVVKVFNNFTKLLSQAKKIMTLTENTSHKLVRIAESPGLAAHPNMQMHAAIWVCFRRRFDFLVFGVVHH